MWEEIFEPLFQNLSHIPLRIVWAILVFILGFFISKWLGELVSAFLNKIQLNQAFQRMGWEEALRKIHKKFQASKFFGKIVKWFFVVLFLLVASEILGLAQLSWFLEKIIGYYPNIFIASIIFIVAVFLADFSQKIFVATLEKEKITYSSFLGRISRWAIWVFAVLAILYQLKIVPDLVLAIFIGLVGAIALASGIAFGLGGKEIAAKILKELEDKFE